MYDLTTVNDPLESADTTFKGFEITFPRARREMIAKNFEDWLDYRDFFLPYVQMMRARSILVFEQKSMEGQNLRIYEIERVNPDGVSVVLRSMEPSRPSRAFVRNFTVAELCTEIQKGAASLSNLDWALRVCESPDDPFVTSESACAIWRWHNISEYLVDPDSLFFFPLCWQACLIGSRRPSDSKTTVWSRGFVETSPVVQTDHETLSCFAAKFDI